MTPSEVYLWDALRHRRVVGVKFRRQHPIGPFIVDFYAPQLRLAVEIDGAVHVNRRERDSLRQRWLEIRGIEVIRFDVSEVEVSRDRVVERIRARVAARMLSMPPDEDDPCA